MICTKLKTFTFVLLMLAFGRLNAQLILTIPNDTIFIALDTLDTGEIVEHWDVSNDTFMSLELMCSRNYLSTVTPYNYPYIQSLPENPVAGAYEKFCWGPLCYNYGTRPMKLTHVSFRRRPNPVQVKGPGGSASVYAKD